MKVVTASVLTAGAAGFLTGGTAGANAAGTAAGVNAGQTHDLATAMSRTNGAAGMTGPVANLAQARAILAARFAANPPLNARQQADLTAATQAYASARAALTNYATAIRTTPAQGMTPAVAARLTTALAVANAPDRETPLTPTQLGSLAANLRAIETARGTANTLTPAQLGDVAAALGSPAALGATQQERDQMVRMAGQVSAGNLGKFLEQMRKFDNDENGLTVLASAGGVTPP